MQRQTEDLAFEGNGARINAALARPEGEGPFPGLVLIPDVRGLYGHYRDVAARFAGEGFLTLAVDLYSREGAPELPDLDSVFRWMDALDDARVLGDLAAAGSFLRDHGEARSDAVAITGFCMGGQYALMAACSDCGYDACVSWYGMLR